MHDAIIKLKDGTHLEGPVWYWRPSEGWFSIASDANYGQIRFDDVVSAVVEERVGPGRVEKVDLLAKAREGGWIPKP